jgi:septum formation inhibitor MinC
MHCQNFRPATVVNLDSLPVLTVVPMNQEDKEKLSSLLKNYASLSKQMELLSKQLEEANRNSGQIELKNRLSVDLENTSQKLNTLLEQKKILEGQSAVQAVETEKMKALQVQARIERQAAEAKLENAKKLKAESDEKVQNLQQKLAAARNRIINELRRSVNVSVEQITTTIDLKHLDQIKANMPKKCLMIDKAAMQNVLLPLIAKFNLVAANFAVFKDEISEEALVTFFANVPSTQIRSISIAKPLSAVETAAKAEIEALIAQRGGSIKVS